MKLQIKRSQWHHQQGVAGSLLKVPYTGKMCCLGFFALAEGYTEEQITNICDLHSLVAIHGMKGEYMPKLLHQGANKVFNNNTLCRRMMAYNDSYAEDFKRVEVFLTGFFEQIGVKLEFVD